MAGENANRKDEARALILQHRKVNAAMPEGNRVGSCPFDGYCVYCGYLFPEWKKKFMSSRHGVPVALVHPCYILGREAVLKIVNEVLFTGG